MDSKSDIYSQRYYAAIWSTEIEKILFQCLNNEK